MTARHLQAAYDYDYSYEYEPDIAAREAEQADDKKQTRPVINTSLRSKCLALVLILSAMAAVTAVGNQLIASRGYALVQAKQEAERLETENEHLKVDIAKLKSPQRIKDIAIKNLGMVVPKDVYFATEKK